MVDASLLLAALVLIIRPAGSYEIDRPAMRLLQLYGVYITLSMLGLVLWCINLSDGIFVWLHLFTLPVFVLLLLLIDRRVPIRREEVSVAISCMAGAAIIIGAVQYGMEVRTGWYLGASDVMRGTFAHKNIFAEVLLLTLPFSLYAGWGSERRRHLPKAISILTILMIGLLLSRAVWIALGAATVLTLAIYLIASGRWVPRLHHFASLLIVIGAGYIAYRWFIKHTDAGDYLAYFYNRRDTVRERQHIWSATWQMIREHPITGSGTGSWKVLNMRYGIVGLRDYRTFFQQPHNDYLWVLSEQGIFAFLAVSAAWIWVAYRLLRQVWARPDDAFLYVLLFALTGYAVYAGLAFPRERAEHMIILAFVVFFVLSESSPLAPIAGSGEGHTEQPVVVPRYALYLLCMALAPGAWWSAERIACEIHLRAFFAARDIDDRAEEARQLRQIPHTYYTLDGTATPIEWYRGMLLFTQGRMDSAERHFAYAVGDNPYHAYSLSNVATCMTMRGDIKDATRYYGLALGYSPGFPDAALNLCAISYNAGSIDSAAMYLGMAQDTLINPRYVKFLDVVTRAEIGPLLAATSDSADYVLHEKIVSLLKSPQWQSSIFKKAYISRRNVKEQVLKDMIWSMQYEDHATVNAAKYLNQLSHYYK
jgi:O-antigen ligase